MLCSFIPYVDAVTTQWDAPHREWFRPSFPTQRLRIHIPRIVCAWVTTGGHRMILYTGSNLLGMFAHASRETFYSRAGPQFVMNRLEIDLEMNLTSRVMD